jgi:hypothetical protein
MARKVLPLVGFKSLRAFNAFHALLLGVKMLPAYMGETYEEFLERVEEMSEADQRKVLMAGARHVALEKEEIESLICFCTDKNGVPYSAENLKNLGPDDLVDVIVEVCLAIGRIKINFVSEAEKKN